MAKRTVSIVEKWHVAMHIKDVQGHVLNVHIGQKLYSCQVVHRVKTFFGISDQRKVQLGLCKVQLGH